jgi:acetyl esterase/lipase
MRAMAPALLLMASLAACAGDRSVTMNGAASDKPVMAWQDLLGRPQPRPDATLAYGSDALQVVDVWRPAGPGPHPVVLMIHGGCWKTAIAERDIMNWIADDLRAHGVGVWNVEYRGVDRGGGFPATYHDVGAAADFLVARGGEFGFDRARPLVAIGHSAGGHLALWLAHRPALGDDDPLRGASPARLALAVSQGGLPDLRAQSQLADHPCGADGAIAMAGGDFARSSPPEMPAGEAREVLFNNDRDRVAPPAFGHAYVAAMARRGRTVEMVVTAGEGHVELIAPDSASWRKQRAFILKALK